MKLQIFLVRSCSIRISLRRPWRLRLRGPWSGCGPVVSSPAVCKGRRGRESERCSRIRLSPSFKLYYLIIIWFLYRHELELISKRTCLADEYFKAQKYGHYCKVNYTICRSAAAFNFEKIFTVIKNENKLDMRLKDI